METKLTILLLNKIQMEIDNYLLIGLDESGKIYRFQALGLDKPNSKNQANLVLYSLIEVEVFLNRKHNGGKLKRANLIKKPKLNSKQKIIFWDTITKLLSNQEQTTTKIFFFLNKLLEHNELDYHIKQGLWWVKIYLESENYQPIVDRCAVCNSNQQIATFVLGENGLLCKKHQNNFLTLNSNLLLKIINLFNESKFENVDWNWNLKDAKVFLKMAIDFCDVTFGTYFYPLLKCF